MDNAPGATDTVFVVKEDRQFCFLFEGDDPLEFYRALMQYTENPETGLRREEALEVMESMVPDRLRSI